MPEERAMSDLFRLLERGYFPRELPPPFNTDSFASNAFAVGKSWKYGSWTSPVVHNLARPGGLRRPLSIPNPVAYYKLAELMASHWKLINKHTWTERLSASRPHVMKNSSRAVVPRYYFGEL